MWRKNNNNPVIIDLKEMSSKTRMLKRWEGNESRKSEIGSCWDRKREVGVEPQELYALTFKRQIKLRLLKNFISINFSLFEYYQKWCQGRQYRWLVWSKMSQQSNPLSGREFMKNIPIIATGILMRQRATHPWSSISTMKMKKKLYQGITSSHCSGKRAISDWPGRRTKKNHRRGASVPK